MTSGQASIDEGRYDRAIREFSALIEAEPTEADGYRGRAEASLLLGRFADAYRDYYAGITAFVVPVHPDALDAINAHYAARLAAAPGSIPALTGASFVQWAYFDYGRAIQLLDALLAVRPDDVFGTLFRGSARVLGDVTTGLGVADLERAIELAPQSADVHYIVADAYTYGIHDPERAFAEASIALERGLDTPRVHAILAFAQLAFGNDGAAATHIERHLELVTTELRDRRAPRGRRVHVPGPGARTRLRRAIARDRRRDDLGCHEQPRFRRHDRCAVRARRHAPHRQRRHERPVRRDRLARASIRDVPAADEFVRGRGHRRVDGDP